MWVVCTRNRDARDDGLRKQTCTLKKKDPQNCKRWENILAPIVQNKSIDPMDNAIVSLLCWGIDPTGQLSIAAQNVRLNTCLNI